MLENYASHGMYIKFTDEEATALEREALDVALAASAADAGCGVFLKLKASVKKCIILKLLGHAIG